MATRRGADAAVTPATLAAYCRSKASATWPDAVDEDGQALRGFGDEDEKVLRGFCSARDFVHDSLERGREALRRLADAMAKVDAIADEAPLNVPGISLREFVHGAAWSDIKRSLAARRGVVRSCMKTRSEWCRFEKHVETFTSLGMLRTPGTLTYRRLALLWVLAHGGRESGKLAEAASAKLAFDAFADAFETSLRRARKRSAKT